MFVEHDAVKIGHENSKQLEKMKVKLGVFSRAAFGKTSEESKIKRAWHELIKKAKIIDTKQLIQDFDNLLTEQWPCNIVSIWTVFART